MVMRPVEAPFKRIESELRSSVSWKSMSVAWGVEAAMLKTISTVNDLVNEKASMEMKCMPSNSTPFLI